MSFNQKKFMFGQVKFVGQNMIFLPNGASKTLSTGKQEGLQPVSKPKFKKCANKQGEKVQGRFLVIGMS